MVATTEIREGFQKTDVGYIPDDWTLEPYTEIASLKHGFQFLEEHFSKLGIGVIKIGNIKDGAGLNLSDLTFIPLENLKRFEKFKLKKGDVLMALTGATLGKVCRVNTEITLLQNYRVGNFIPNEKTIRDYVYHISQSEIVQRIVKDLVNSGAQPNLGKRDFDKILIPLPPTLSEQTAIATALNDTDALITQLEKLIAKKRAVKQGAMQELLKPKEDWVKKTLGEVATLKARIGWQGLTTAEYRKSGDYFLITGTEFKNGFIDWERCFYVDEERYKQDKNIQVKAHDVLVTKDGTIGKVALIKSVPKPATLNSGVFVIRPTNNSFHPEFFYYLLLSEVFLIFLSQLSAGSTIIHLYQKDFVTFKFSTPKTLEEQIRIAQILSDMDTEIEALEKKLEKTKKIKQGMMQELLTGRIRLI